jgi:hypothetical protein
MSEDVRDPQRPESEGETNGLVGGEKGSPRNATSTPNGVSENGSVAPAADGYHASEPAAWARDVVPMQTGDSAFPWMFPGVNTVLNRGRLARWLTEFRDDADVAEFLLLDIVAMALQIDISSTSVRTLSWWHAPRSRARLLPRYGSADFGFL